MAVDLADMFRRAAAAVESGNYDYAVELFREILRIDPEHVKARVALRGCARKRYDEKGSLARAAGLLKGILPMIRIYANFSKPNKTIEACEDCLLHTPYSVHVLTKEGFAARKAGHQELALLVFEDIRQRHPGRIEAIRQLGQIYEDDKGEPAKALDYFRQIHVLVPADADVNKKVKDLEARTHMEGQHLTTDSSFRDNLRDGEGQAELLRKDGEDYVVRSDEQLDGQILEWQQRIKDEPGDPTHYSRLGDLYDRKKDPKKAIAAYQKALEIDPKNFQCHAKIGDIKLRHGEQRITAMEEKLGDPPDPKLQAKIEAGKKELAAFRIQEYAWRTEAHPTDLRLKAEFGDALRLAGEVDRAIAQYQAALQDVRIRVRCRIALGECFMHKGQHDLATSQFEQTLDSFTFLNDEAKQVHYHIAVCGEAMGDIAKALTHYKEIYEADIGYSDVAQKIDELTAKKSQG